MSKGLERDDVLDRLAIREVLAKLHARDAHCTTSI